MTRQNGYGEPAQTDMISFLWRVISLHLLCLETSWMIWPMHISPGKILCSSAAAGHAWKISSTLGKGEGSKQVNPFIAALESTFNICCPRSTLHQPMQIWPMNANDHLYYTSPDYSRTNHKKKKRIQQLLHTCLHNTCSKTSPRHFIALCSVILRNTARSNTKTGFDFACRMEHACATWEGNLQRESSVVGTANEIHLGRPSPTERNARECLYQTSRG